MYTVYGVRSALYTIQDADRKQIFDQHADGRSGPRDPKVLSSEACGGPRTGLSEGRGASTSAAGASIAAARICGRTRPAPRDTGRHTRPARRMIEPAVRQAGHCTVCTRHLCQGVLCAQCGKPLNGLQAKTPMRENAGSAANCPYRTYSRPRVSLSSLTRLSLASPRDGTRPRSRRAFTAMARNDHVATARGLSVDWLALHAPARYNQTEGPADAIHVPQQPATSPPRYASRQRCRRRGSHSASARSASSGQCWLAIGLAGLGCNRYTTGTRSPSTSWARCSA